MTSSRSLRLDFSTYAVSDAMVLCISSSTEEASTTVPAAATGCLAGFTASVGGSNSDACTGAGVSTAVGVVGGGSAALNAALTSSSEASGARPSASRNFAGSIPDSSTSG